jgi:type I restriction enzyme S subunit
MITQRYSATPHPNNYLSVEVDRRQALAPYPSYKPARVHWLGEIPAHWQEKRGKYFFREIDERSVTGEEELLSVSHTTGVTPRSQKNVTMFKAESYVGHKVARTNDIVVNTMWAWMSALGVSKHVGIVSPSYGVYRPLNRQDYLPEFIDYLLRTPAEVGVYLPLDGHPLVAAQIVS